MTLPQDRETWAGHDMLTHFHFMLVAKAMACSQDSPCNAA